MKTKLTLLLATLLLTLTGSATRSHAAPGDVVLVEAGQPRAVVVTADPPSRMAAYAVEELVAHVKKAS